MNPTEEASSAKNELKINEEIIHHELETAETTFRRIRISTISGNRIICKNMKGKL